MGHHKNESSCVKAILTNQKSEVEDLILLKQKTEGSTRVLMVLEAYMLTSSVVSISVCLILLFVVFYWKMPKHFTKSMNIIFLLSCIQLLLMKGIY